MEGTRRRNRLFCFSLVYLLSTIYLFIYFHYYGLTTGHIEPTMMLMGMFIRRLCSNSVNVLKLLSHVSAFPWTTLHTYYRVKVVVNDGQIERAVHDRLEITPEWMMTKEATRICVKDQYSTGTGTNKSEKQKSVCRYTIPRELSYRTCYTHAHTPAGSS